MAMSKGQGDQALEDSFKVLERQWPSWTWLRDRLRRSGLEATSARELRSSASRSSWAILAKPSEALVRHFELAPEVLVLCSPWDEMQANDIKRAESLFREEMRVDPGFALVITHDQDAEARLRPILPDSRLYLFVLNETFEHIQDPQKFLRDLLRDALGGRRLFDWRTPAAGPQFFGRDKELEALSRDIVNGHCLGVFGLRKVGKTSLLRRVSEKFRESGPRARRVIPVEVDLQMTSYNRRNFSGVIELVLRELDGELQRAQISAPSPSSDPQARFVEAVQHVERALGARILLILDEYEVLLAGRIPQRDGVEILTWLRGVAQTHARSFSLVLAGRNSRLLAPARIDGADNPMYRFLRSVPLAGLTPEDCRSMVRTIGGRLALRFAPDALDIIVEESGGHPALVRTLGDLVDQTTSPTERTPAPIDTGAIRSVLPRFSREVDDDMRELVDASNDFDPRAADYLIYLSYEIPWIGGPSEARITDALIDYGILHRENHRFRIGRLATWLRENHARPLRAAAHG